MDSVQEYIQELCQSIKIRQPVALMEELKEICRACSRIGDVSPRMIDLIISYGERMAAEILTAAIESNVSLSTLYLGDNRQVRFFARPCAKEQQGRLLRRVYQEAAEPSRRL